MLLHRLLCSFDLFVSAAGIRRFKIPPTLFISPFIFAADPFVSFSIIKECSHVY